MNNRLPSFSNRALNTLKKDNKESINESMYRCLLMTSWDYVYTIEHGLIKEGK